MNHLYGESMILAECIFSQSATGEVSSAYFRKLDHLSGWGVQIFAEGEEEEDEEVAGRGGERKRRRNPNLTAAATKFPM